MGRNHKKKSKNIINHNNDNNVQNIDANHVEAENVEGKHEETLKHIIGPVEAEDTKDSFLEKLWHQVFHKYSGLEIILLCLTLVMVIVTVVSLNILGQKNKLLAEQERIIETLSNQSAENTLQTGELQSQLDEANNQLQLVSESLNMKTQEVEALSEADKSSRIPSAYPLKGTAAIYTDNNEVNDNDTDEDAGNQIDEMEESYGDETISENEIPTTYFITGADTRVVSTGSGKVISVSEDPEYGYCVEIDHENGYISTYKGFGIVLVNEGDTVVQGCDIMRIVDENRLFQYRISYNGEYIDPMTCMEING